MKQSEYKLAKGFATRYEGKTVTFDVPATLEECRALVAEGVDADAVIVDRFNGQGYILGLQKAFKDELEKDSYAAMDADEAIAAARQVVQDKRLGAPRVKGEGTSGKVAKAEAKAAAALTGVKGLYAALTKAQRRQQRDVLVNGGIVTAEEIDQWDAELG